MERLYQITLGLALIVGLAARAQTSPQTACSLAVRVLTPDGQRPEAPVSVKEENGHIHVDEQEDGDVHFCALGILPVTVTVGSDGLCNQVVVRNVPVTWDEPYL